MAFSGCYDYSFVLYHVVLLALVLQVQAAVYWSVATTAIVMDQFILI